MELDQVAREIHESFREVGRLQNFMGQIRKFKELIEHAESVSGEPITLFILHLDVDVGESKLHTCTVWYFAPNIIQRKNCNEKGLRGPESRPVLNLHHYILDPIKNRGSGTPVGKFGDALSLLCLADSGVGRSSANLSDGLGRLVLNTAYRKEFLQFVVKRVDNKPKAPLLESCKTLELATVPGGHTA